MLFSHTRLNSKLIDLRVEDGKITQIEPAGSLATTHREEHTNGGWLTPVMAEPHVHLDAALLGNILPNRSGTLREGIANWSKLRADLTTDDVIARAVQTAEMYASKGTLRLRTHVDTGSMLAIEAMVEVKRRLLESSIELEIVAFPQEGILRAPGRRAAWEAASAKADCVGGIPHFERTTDEGWRSVHLAFDLAEKLHKKLDFHCDETDDPHSRNLEVVCAEAIDRGHTEVVAGHCTALHSYNHPHAEKVMELVAAAGVQVVTNPLDNVVLQGRYDRYPRRRGITRVDELWRVGCIVGIGHDSVQDPWYPLGTANMLDPAYMLVHVGQLTSEADMERVFATLWTENHLPFGTPPVLEVGEPARMLWWPAQTAKQVFIDRPTPRVFS